ncbi:MAG: hypothetical protein ACI9KE_002423 [Polyangiales bacterium]|jgi:hypothetical protein
MTGSSPLLWVTLRSSPNNQLLPVVLAAASLALASCIGVVEPSNGASECTPGQTDTCYPDAEGIGAARLCHIGTRYCRGGDWSGCEEVESYFQGSLGALITGAEACTSCNPACFVSTDYPDDGDLTPDNSSGVEYCPDDGGICISSEMNGPLVPPPGCDAYAVLERGEETVVTIMATLPADAAASEVGVDDDPASAVDERGFVQDTAPSVCPAGDCILGPAGDQCQGCNAGAALEFTLTLSNGFVTATPVVQSFEFDAHVYADGVIVETSRICVDVPAIRDPSMCTSFGLSCLADADCCTGVCDAGPGLGFNICGSVGGACLSDGGSCTQTADCCSGACADGVCDSSASCVSYSDACVSDGDCCSSLCNAGACDYASTTSCLPTATACIADIECCSGNCLSNGKCQSGAGVGPVCLAVGESCVAREDCCSTVCDGGECGRTSFCRADGEPCVADNQCCGTSCDAGSCKNVVDECLPRYALCDLGAECCGLRCGDDGTGVDRCIPLGGCFVAGPTPSRPFGEDCRGDEYCCSGDCTADPSGDNRCRVVRSTGCSAGDAVANGEQCNNDCQCQSNSCVHVGVARTHQRCSLGLSECVVDGDECAIPEDCCGGTCDLHPDRTWRCGPATDGGLLPSGSYTQDYDANERCAIPPDRPDWQSLSWTATIPAGTRIEFEIRTASDSLGLMTATPAIIDVPPATSPVDIGDLLVAAGLQNNNIHLRVTVILYASADLSTSPVVSGFEVQYMCVPSE